MNILNKTLIYGIRPAVWDRYLSYHINKNAKPVCVDIVNDITETFRLCLINEGNKRNIEIVNKNIFEYVTNTKFDIVIVIGSAILEIGFYNNLFKKHFQIQNIK